MTIKAAEKYSFSRLPQHIGVIPDGNRRWAVEKGLKKEEGYARGINPGLQFYHDCLQLGIQEITLYGFTQDNTKRPAVQRIAFQQACIDAVMELSNLDAALLVVGNTDSPMFPQQLIPFTKKRVVFGKGRMKVNFLVNYGWQWDLNNALINYITGRTGSFAQSIASADISRIDLIIRWGGRRRLSGFLPVQTIYADFYVVDDYWPDYQSEHLYQALKWYETQEITLGG